MHGLKQGGHPLSPFLFTLVADAFSQILSTGNERNLFKGFNVGKNKLPYLISNMPMTLSSS